MKRRRRLSSNVILVVLVSDGNFAARRFSTANMTSKRTLVLPRGWHLETHSHPDRACIIPILHLRQSIDKGNFLETSIRARIRHEEYKRLRLERAKVSWKYEWKNADECATIVCARYKVFNFSNHRNCFLRFSSFSMYRRYFNRYPYKRVGEKLSLHNISILYVTLY